MFRVLVWPVANGFEPRQEFILCRSKSFIQPFAIADFRVQTCNVSNEFRFAGVFPMTTRFKFKFIRASQTRKIPFVPVEVRCRFHAIYPFEIRFMFADSGNAPNVTRCAIN